MNRYRGFADVGTQLKVENPVPLRTIVNFDLLPFSQGLTTSVTTLIYPEALIKLD
jgi:hypothetical protein